MEQSVKTGTTTVAVKYKDGVIIAADKRATAGNLIAETDIQKVIQVSPRMAITIAGVVSDAQLFSRYLRSEIRLLQLRINREPTVHEVAQLLASLMYGSMRQYFPSIVHFLLAGVDGNGPHIYDISPDGAIFEKKGHATSGSGSIFVMGIFDSDYVENQEEQGAVRLVKKGLRAAMRRDSASGNGADIFKISFNEGVKKVATLTVDNGIAID